jgi:hypothetical protein
MKKESRFYIICASLREDMIPTSYYDPNGKLITDKHCVARFWELEHLLEFIAKHEIKLGNNAYIGLLIEDDERGGIRNYEEVI